MKFSSKIFLIISLITTSSVFCAEKDKNEPTWKTHLIDAVRGFASGMLQSIASNAVFIKKINSYTEQYGTMKMIKPNLHNTICILNGINILLDSKQSLEPSIFGIIKRLAFAALARTLFQH